MASSSPADISLIGKIANYTEILAKDPRSPAFAPLADTYRQLGMLDEALDVAEQGVKVLPRFAPGHMILGRICLELKNPDAAVAALEKAYALDPLSLPAIQGLARALVSKGQKERAREVVEKGALAHPEDAVLRQMLASLGGAPAPAGTGQGGPAAGVRVRPDEDPIATSTIAEIYLKQGLPQRALKVYRDLLHADPQNELLLGKIMELEASLRMGTAGSAAGGPSADGLSKGQPGLDRSRHLELLDRWLAAVRERKVNVR